MMQSADHKHLFLADLEWMIVPPILLGQYKLYVSGKQPIAFAAWAYLSDVAEGRVKGGNARISPTDWRSGDRLWLLSVVAPFGHADMVLNDLKETNLKGKAFKLHRRSHTKGTVIELVGQ